MDAPNTPILVWDRIVRIGHWLLALSFLVAYVSAESERWRMVHVASGCVVVAAVFMRLIWGTIGSQHARFSSFVRAPRQAIGYLKSLATLRPENHAGHNPAGGWAVVGLLSLSALASSTGWMAYNDIGGTRMGRWHETLSNLALLLVIVHVFAVLASSCLHRENLVRTMLTGWGKGHADQSIRDIGVFGVCLYFVALAGLAYAATILGS